MRFLKTFSRVVIALGGTTLGTDAVPTGNPRVTANGCQASAAFANNVGFPIQRMVVAYHYAGVGAPKLLPARLYVLSLIHI